MIFLGIEHSVSVWDHMMQYREKIKYFWQRYRFYIIPIALVTVFTILLFWSRIVVNVEAGHAAVKWERFFGGTVTDQYYGEGFHAIFPWDKMFIYDIRLQETRHEMKVITRNALTITLDLSIRYRPEAEMLGILHKTIGQDYVRKIVIPEIESALRTAIGGWDVEDLYYSRQMALASIIRDAIDNVGVKYIIVDTVIIRSITFPPLIADAIEQKVREKQLAEAYEYILVKEEKEAERKTIEAGGYKRYNDILNSSITNQVLRWKGIEATLKLAESNNAKIVMIGNSSKEMPIILNTVDSNDTRADAGTISPPYMPFYPLTSASPSDTTTPTAQNQGGKVAP
jgi:regulator of protease activity HflC (stomatin/prohibitin superfamily)